MSPKIVVVGAGVTGLTTALLLSNDNKGYAVTVAAKHMPGDYDIEYASPWAGANYMPVSKAGSVAAQHDQDTWPFLADLAQNRPDAGVHFQKLGPGIDHATEFTSVCINTAIYLPWLVSECLKNGVVFKRAAFGHVAEAARIGVHHSGLEADLVVNATGLSAAQLGGVEDKSVVPARGQIVVVRNDAGAMYSVSGTDDGTDEAMYIMTRAAGGGTVLGGCYQKGNWESQPDPNLAVRIMRRSLEACPRLGQKLDDLDIIRHAVGLRPVRENGVRLEGERIHGVLVVHNYGHGGFGYQSSYGCALQAVDLVEESLSPRAKL